MRPDPISHDDPISHFRAEFRETTQPTNLSVYFRSDPRENEAALREALPALYLSFQTVRSHVNQQAPAQ
jgi:hypothetical protein